MPKMTFTRKQVYDSRPCKVGDEVEVEDRFVAILRHLNVAQLSKVSSTVAPRGRGRPPKVVAPPPVVAVEPPPVVVVEPPPAEIDQAPIVFPSPIEQRDAVAMAAEEEKRKTRQRDMRYYQTRDMTAEGGDYDRKSTSPDDEVS